MALHRRVQVLVNLTNKTVYLELVLDLNAKYDHQHTTNDCFEISKTFNINHTKKHYLTHHNW